MLGYRLGAYWGNVGLCFLWSFLCGVVVVIFCCFGVGLGFFFVGWVFGGFAVFCLFVFSSEALLWLTALCHFGSLASL